MAKRTQKPKCASGTPCGYTCISGKRQCSSKIQKRDADALLTATGVSSSASQGLASQVQEVKPYKVAAVLGNGAFGQAVLTDRGTVVKTVNGDGIDMPTSQESLQAEFKALGIMHKLGVGPEPLGISKDIIEMSVIKGRPLIDELQDTEFAKASQEDAMQVAKALVKMHKVGLVHNDMHAGNAIKADDGSIKLIDAGLARMAGDNDGSHGLADIARVLEGRPELASLYKALEKDEAEYFDSLDKAYKMADFSSRTRARGAAKLAYHNAYLAVVDQFIK